jgi:hypothetical protein
MANSFFAPQTFPFMLGEREVGTFTVDCTSHGQYEYTLHLHASDFPIPWAWQDRNDQFIDASRGQLHHDVMLCWVEERVFPKERHNAADILHSIGLSDYDQFEVLKATRLRHRYDAFWIRVDSADTYAETILPHWRR